MTDKQGEAVRGRPQHFGASLFLGAVRGAVEKETHTR
jgi:hypothetical protein